VEEKRTGIGVQSYYIHKLRAYATIKKRIGAAGFIHYKTRLADRMESLNDLT
jgi:hypothetical protein